MHEGFNGASHVDLPGDRKALLIADLWRLAGFGVICFVIADSYPCKEAPVELIESKDVAGPDFGFELALNGLEESFHEAAWRGVIGRAVQKSDVEAMTGGPEADGMIDLGIVHI